MMQLHQWFKSNKLTLNAEKSNFVVFRSKRKKNLNDIPDQLQFENQKISRNNSVKYLGVTLDEHLTWNEHIIDLCNKLKRHFKTFYCIRRYLNKKQVKSIYYALIYSRIKYGITVYGSANKNMIAKIQTLQNKLLKVLMAKNYRYSTNSLHNELGILKVSNIAKTNTVTFIHNYFHDKLPKVFKNYFTVFSEVHNINTRGSTNNIIIANHKTNFGHSTMKIKGAKLLNNIDADTKKAKECETIQKTAKNNYITVQIWPTYITIEIYVTLIFSIFSLDIKRIILLM